MLANNSLGRNNDKSEYRLYWEEDSRILSDELELGLGWLNKFHDTFHQAITYIKDVV